MADEPLYALVQGNRLHVYPAHEECNLDDAKIVVRDLSAATVEVVRDLSAATVEAMEEDHGSFERCEHCFPMATARTED